MFLLREGLGRKKNTVSSNFYRTDISVAKYGLVSMILSTNSVSVQSYTVHSDTSLLQTPFGTAESVLITVISEVFTFQG